jgi:catechol 2,3-dioxygenase-like lactoylglutathione lyase family enzyme
MARGLDHVVHAVSDLDAAAAFYQRLGFAVGPRNRHPWGTENRLIQFPGCFVELLAVAEPGEIPPHGPKSFSFGAFNRDFLAEAGEGLSCLALESRDPAAENAALTAAGFGGFEPFEFARTGKRADGGEVEVAFSLTFARDPASPHAAFFTCLHKRPENFWSPELQQHENGASTISAAVFVAESPTDHHIFLSAFSGVRRVRSTSLGISVATPRGTIQIMERRGFRDAYGEEPPAGEGMRFAALVFGAEDSQATGALLRRNGMEARKHAGGLVMGPERAHGATLVFHKHSS